MKVLGKLEPYIDVEAKCIHCDNVNRTKVLLSEPPTKLTKE